MRNLFCIAFLAAWMTACQTAPPVDGGSTTTTTLPQVTTTTLPPVAQEPASHEQPLAITNQGLKVGGGYLASKSATVWTFSTNIGFDHNAPQCGMPLPALSSSCVMGSACKANNGIFRCVGGQTLFKIFGWIFQDFGNYQKPLADVVVDKFWFAGCMGGNCQGLHETKTDEWGYFEMFSGDVLDTLRIVGKPGFHGFCRNGKPTSGGGSAIQFISASKGPSDKKQFDGAFKQYDDKDCKPINVLAKSSSQAMPEGVPYEKSAGLWCVMKAGKEVCKADKTK